MMFFSCSFIGRNFGGFFFGYQEEHFQCVAMKAALLNQMEALMQKGVTHFLLGTTLVTDLWAAEAALMLRERYAHITLVCVVPCRAQKDHWPQSNQARYKKIINRADKVIVLQPDYTMDCVLKRNHYLVDKAYYVLSINDAAMEESDASTVRYAKVMGREIILIDPLTKEVAIIKGFGGMEGERRIYSGKRMGG